MVLLVSLDEVDAFEDVGDVVDPPLWYAQLLHRVIKIQALLICFHQQLYELLRQFHQAVLLPALLARVRIVKTRIVVFAVARRVSDQGVASFVHGRLRLIL